MDPKLASENSVETEIAAPTDDFELEFDHEQLGDVLSLVHRS